MALILSMLSSRIIFHDEFDSYTDTMSNWVASEFEEGDDLKTEEKSLYRNHFVNLDLKPEEHMHFE